MKESHFHQAGLQSHSHREPKPKCSSNVSRLQRSFTLSTSPLAAVCGRTFGWLATEPGETRRPNVRVGLLPSVDKLNLQQVGTVPHSMHHRRLQPVVIPNLEQAYLFNTGPHQKLDKL
jgi:hypothetical protein